MSKKVTVRVLPSAEHPDYLTIHDAMTQIADAFALLRGDSENYDWRLIKAETNSPLTAVGELMMIPGIADGLLASAELEADEVYQQISDLMDGDDCGDRLDSKILRRMLLRNRNGIGRTVITVEGDARSPVEITPERALVGLDLTGTKPPLAAPRRVRGSLEGALVDAGSYRNHPALKLRERTRGRILWCRIPREMEASFAQTTSLSDVWQNARVRLRGWIEYSRSGKISSMTAEKIEHVKSRPIAESDIIDPNFTGGMSAIQYLDKLRDGELG